MQWLLTSFLKGLLFVVPVTATFILTAWAFHHIDGLLHIPIPGLGFVLTIALTIMIGALASNLLVEKTFLAIERGVTQLPLVKLIYFSIKDLIGAFVGEKKRFSAPVLVAMSGDPAIRMVGFVTREDASFLGLTDHVAIYLPQAYNFSGITVVVPRSRIEFLPATDAAKLMAFIISGGVSTATSNGMEGFATSKMSTLGGKNV